jgi:tRNA (mo5U34)-methyltransferase
MRSSDAQRREREIAALGPWFHNLHLPDGTQTAPGHSYGDFPSFKWRHVARAVPQSLDGWTALDLGCNAGFYSVELAKRGARVTAIDVDSRYVRQARWVAEQFGLEQRIAVSQRHVYALANDRRRYDLVWFTGVFYHLRYPLLALDLVRRATNRLLVFQTMTMPGAEVADPPRDLPLDDRDAMLDEGWPKMAFIEHSVAQDPTNWWAPNHACVEALLRSAGFRIVARPEHEFYFCEPVDYTRPTDFDRWTSLIGPQDAL